MLGVFEVLSSSFGVIHNMCSELVSEWTYPISECTYLIPERRCSGGSVFKYASDFDCDSDLVFLSFGSLFFLVMLQKFG